MSQPVSLGRINLLQWRSSGGFCCFCCRRDTVAPSSSGFHRRRFRLWDLSCSLVRRWFTCFSTCWISDFALSSPPVLAGDEVYLFLCHSKLPPPPPPPRPPLPGPPTRLSPGGEPANQRGVKRRKRADGASPCHPGSDGYSRTEGRTRRHGAFPADQLLQL